MESAYQESADGSQASTKGRVGTEDGDRVPSHLVILVHGITAT